MIRLPVVPPDASGFALARTNFDVLDSGARDAWYAAMLDEPAMRRVPPPERVILELANTCNLDCPMCRVGEHGVDLRRVMPLEMLRRVCMEILSTAREVRLNGLGETTVIPALGTRLDEIERTRCRVELITNATGPLTVYERILARGGTLLVSWDAGTPALFEKLRRPATWSASVDALTAIATAAARHEGAGAQVWLLFTLQPSNTAQLELVVELARRVGARGVLTNVAKLGSDEWLQRVQSDAAASFEKAATRAMQIGVELVLPDRLGSLRLQVPGARVTSATRCDRPWREVVVRWDGTVQVCNMFNPYVYGHLASAPFARIWGGAFAGTFRRMFHGDQGHPYCRGCAYIGGIGDSA